MRISFNDIEEARRDPSAYLRKRSTPNKGFFGNSKFYTMQLAVYRYHKLNANLTAAQQYLAEGFQRRFKQQGDFPKYAEKLDRYADDFIRSGATVIRVKDRLSLSLKENFPQLITVSGEIPRVDLTSSGYTAWLFSKETTEWEDELRLPLIQSAYAEAIGAPLEEIKIGMYNFSSGEQWTRNFSEKDIEQAEASLSRLLRQIIELSRERIPP